jgi:hypothetical protein
VPIGVTYGRTKAEVSDERAPVENEDVATFTATFECGAVGTPRRHALRTTCPTDSASNCSPHGLSILEPAPPR